VTSNGGGAKRASVVRSANSGGARPGSCGPVRRSANAMETVTRSIGEWFWVVQFLCS